jgi:hypothetical protein
MDMNKAAEICRETGGSKAGKGLMHDGNGANLFFGELVGALEIIDFYFAGIGGRAEVFRFRVTGVDSGKKLINLFLR